MVKFGADICTYKNIYVFHYIYIYRYVFHCSENLLKNSNYVYLVHNSAFLGKDENAFADKNEICTIYLLCGVALYKWIGFRLMHENYAWMILGCTYEE